MTLFTAQHEAFRQQVREVIERELAPRADEWEQPGRVTKQVLQLFGDFGWFGLSVPREYGGSGLDFGYEIVLVEELPRSRMMGLPLSFAAQAHFVVPFLVQQGTAEQRSRFLPKLLSGEAVAALAATEPGGGTDLVRSVQCSARDDGDSWVISGEKKFITNGPIADYVLTLVRTARPGHGTSGFALVLVPTDTPGFEVVATLRTMGMRSSPTGWLRFRDCRVPKSMTIGKPHLGLLYLMNGLQRERLVTSASALSLASLLLEETIQRVRQRRLYDRPLGDLQTVRHRIAEMAAQIECCRRFVHSVAESFRDGRIESKEICMIKFLVMETVQRVVEQCAQLHGAEGYLEDHWVARAYRDVRMFTIGGGVSELMKDLVAGYLRV
jgi:alkylation response protein AidB-like acyl-CoA dehydrogenase